VSNILNHDQVNKQHKYIVNCHLAVVEVVVRKIWLMLNTISYCNESSCARSSRIKHWFAKGKVRGLNPPGCSFISLSEEVN